MFASLEGSCSSHLQDLGCAGEVDPLRGLKRSNRTPHPAPVAGVHGGGGRHLRPRKVLELVSQAWLVVFHAHRVVAATAEDVAGALALTVQSVGGHDGLGQLELLQQYRQCGDLVALGIHGQLPRHDTGVMGQRGEQVRHHTIAVGGFRAATCRPRR